MVRILCVDDDKDGCEMIVEFLRFHNSSYQVASVPDSTEAMKAIALEKSDIYILDNWLPGESGVELCKRIRLSDAITPIIMFSAVAYAQDIKQGLDAGADAYLKKPNDLSNLGPTIDRLLSAGTSIGQPF
jgi:DNA-binding response OmpR family regulator